MAQNPNSKTTIIAVAVLAALIGSLLHEGLGHGVTAWLRGDGLTQLSSNHLDSIREDRWVDAAGTLVNFIAGFIFLLASRIAGSRANLRYFLWFLGAINLLHAAGYFLFSGALNVGDWAQVIAGLPHHAALRICMAVTGVLLYVLFLRLIIGALRPFCPDRRSYNTVGRLPYYTACAYMCIAGALDPMGWKLMLLSTIPAYFGGLSGFLWGDVFLIGRPAPVRTLTVHRSWPLVIAAALLGIAFLLIVAPGIDFYHAVPRRP
ncbi:MAG: hypothetical protein ACLGSD_18340 [Acidobacteriota bacterium]